MKIVFRLFLLVTLLSAVSCMRYRNLVLLNEQHLEVDTSAYSSMKPYKIQNKDVLNISVASTDAASIKIFTKTLGNGAVAAVSESSLYLNGYIVDDSGRVAMPIVGNIDVEGLSIYEIRDKIQTKINSYYKYAIVDVKLVSFRFSILGEVTRKGNFTIYRDQINLLEALALANGFSDLAKRTEVKLIRNVNGKNKVRQIDFTSENLMNDEWYYLQPNDIIYVEPIRAKSIKNNTATISLSLSALSFILVVVNLLNR